MTFAPIAYDVSHRGSISVGLVEVPKPEAMRVRGGMWFQAGPVGLHLGIEPDMRPSVKASHALR